MGSRVTEWPSTRTSPLVGAIRVDSTDIVVVFPAPLAEQAEDFSSLDLKGYIVHRDKIAILFHQLLDF
jgi:hypothetical protein